MLLKEGKTAARQGVSKDVILGGNSDGDEVDVLPKAESKDLSEQRLGRWVTDRAFAQAVFDVLIVHMEDHLAVALPVW